MDGEHPFAYALIPTIERYGIGKLRARLYRLNNDLMNPNYADQGYEVTKIRHDRILCKKLIADHKWRDTPTYDAFKKNYEKLISALKTLVQNGDLKFYTVRPNGYLRVQWFESYVKPHIDIIKYRIRSAENERNIDGYNTYENDFNNIAMNYFGIDRTTIDRDTLDLWPDFKYLTLGIVGSGNDVAELDTDGGYDPKGENRPFKDMKCPMRPIDGKPLILYEKEFNYCIVIMAIVLNFMKGE
ncbi:MAG: hypothetical protein ACW98X_21490 [Promethearchaeota archaeon]